MNVSSKTPVAMVLPVPVKQPSSEKSLKFVDLSGYPKLFEDLEALYPQPQARSLQGMPASAPAPANFLPVEKVGSFVASFAPTLADMARLDPQFRLPDAAWKALPPKYGDYGFAVFQLQAGEQKLHPMAFEFATSEPRRLFFPTVHVHDGAVHESAEFDHNLYCQAPGKLEDSVAAWSRSAGNASTTVKVGKTAGLVAPETCLRARLYGHRPNQDVWAS
jgi:hypothetical protein